MGLEEKVIAATFPENERSERPGGEKGGEGRGKLSIVIVTMNTGDLVAGLLASLEADKSLGPDAREVIVVDNGSTDGTGDMIRRQFPWVSYVGEPENRGFAAAVNRGFRSSSGEFVLFLNSDTRLIEGEIAKLLSFMEHDNSVGIAAPQLVYEDMRPQRSFAAFPSLASELVPRPLVEALFPRFSTKGGPSDAPRDVSSLIGAAMMVRRRLLFLLGGFDERFFFFLEETDLCLRAAKEGFRVVFFPGARMVHLQGRTVSRSWVRGRIEYSISLYRFIRKYHSRAYYSLFVMARFCRALSFLVPVTLLPFVLWGKSVRKRYRYYAALFLWHLRGCPDDAGLRFSSRG